MGKEKRSMRIASAKRERINVENDADSVQKEVSASQTASKKTRRGKQPCQDPVSQSRNSERSDLRRPRHVSAAATHENDLLDGVKNQILQSPSMHSPTDSASYQQQMEAPEKAHPSPIAKACSDTSSCDWIRTEDVVVVREWGDFCHWKDEPMPVQMVHLGPSDDPRIAKEMLSSPESIPLFGSLQGPSGGHDHCSVCINVGGAVSALDWLPDTSRGACFLAVGARPTHLPTSVINRPELGPSALQIWTVPPPSRPSGPDKRLVTEKAPAVMAILHTHGAVRDLKWCPGSSSLSKRVARESARHLPSLGLLAAAFGDGSVQIFCVPEPSAVLATQRGATNSNASSAGKPVLGVKLKSWFTGRLPENVEGVPLQLSWHPHFPHSRLAVAFSSGLVAIWELGNIQSGASTSARQPEVLFLATRDTFSSNLPVFVAWAPLNEDGSDADTLGTCALDGRCIHLWDCSNPFDPIAKVLTSAMTIVHSMTWSTSMGLFLVCCDDGALRLATFTDQAIVPLPRTVDDLAYDGLVCVRTQEPVIWDADGMKELPVFAYCGNAGEVACSYWEGRFPRVRPVHFVVASITHDSASSVLRIKPASRDGTPHGDLHDGSTAIKYFEWLNQMKESTRKPEQSEKQRVRFVRWGPQVKHPIANSKRRFHWLAHGGQAGLVYCQLLEPLVVGLGNRYVCNSEHM